MAGSALHNGGSERFREDGLRLAPKCRLRSQTHLSCFTLDALSAREQRPPSKSIPPARSISLGTRPREARTPLSGAHTMLSSRARSRKRSLEDSEESEECSRSGSAAANEGEEEEGEEGEEEEPLEIDLEDL